MADEFFYDDDEAQGQEQGQKAPATDQEPKKFEINPDWDINQFIDAYSDYKGVPKKLIHSVATQESTHGKNTGPSSKGARGMFQYRPETAEKLGINPDDPFEAAAQTINDFSARYKKYRDKSESDDHAWQRAVAGHYTGDTNLDESVAAGKYLPETFNPDSPKDPTTPEYVRDVWSRYLGTDAASQQKAETERQAALSLGMKPLPAEAKAYENITEADIKKMKPAERKAYEEWVQIQTTEAGLNTPLAPNKNFYATGYTSPAQAKAIEIEQQQMRDYGTTGSAMDIGAGSDKAVVYSVPEGKAYNSLNEADPGSSYDQFLRDANKLYQAGKQSGDWKPYEDYIRNHNFAPVTFTPSSDDPLTIQHELEAAIRQSASQITKSQYEIDAMIAEWRGTSPDGGIHIYNPSTGEEMIPQAGQPFSVYMSANQTMRLRDHALKMAYDLQKEKEDGISPTRAFSTSLLMRLGHSATLGGLTVYGTGQALRLLDDKFGKDFATLSYNPATGQYGDIGTHAEDYGLVPGTQAYERVQSNLDFGGMVGTALGEIAKIFAAHSAVSKLEGLLQPGLAKLVGPVASIVTKAAPNAATTLTTLGGETLLSSAIQESAGVITQRVSQALATAMSWGGFNILTPEAVTVDYDKANNALDWSRAVLSGGVDLDGNPTFRPEAWTDFLYRYGREVETLLLMQSMIFPIGKGFEATLTNPKFRSFIKPAWLAFRERGGVSRIDAEIELHDKLTNGALLNAFTQSVASPLQSYVFHPNLDWKSRLVDIAQFGAMGAAIHASALRGPRGTFYFTEPDTGTLYRATAYREGLVLDEVKQAPKGAEVYNPTNRADLDIYSQLLVHSYGSAAQQDAMFNNIPKTAPAVPQSMQVENSILNGEQQELPLTVTQPAPVQEGGLPLQETIPFSEAKYGKSEPTATHRNLGAEDTGVAEPASEVPVTGNERSVGVTGTKLQPSEEPTEGTRGTQEAGTAAVPEQGIQEGARTDLKGKVIVMNDQKYTLTGEVQERKGKRYIMASSKQGNFPIPEDVVDAELGTQPAVKPARQPKLVEQAPDVTTEGKIVRPDIQGKKVKIFGDNFELTGDVVEKGGVRFVKMRRPGARVDETLDFPEDVVNEQLKIKGAKKAAEQPALPRAEKLTEAEAQKKFDRSVSDSIVNMQRNAPDAPLPDWAKEHIDRLSGEADRTGLGDKIEDLSAQGLVAKQIANQLGTDVETVRAVRAKRNIPAADEEGFREWVQGRSSAARAASDIKQQESLEAKKPEAGAAPNEFAGKVVVFNNKSYKLTGNTEQRGNVTYYEGTDTKGNTQWVDESAVTKKRYFRIQSLFDENGNPTPWKDKLRRALTRFNIDRATRHFDVTDLGNAKTIDGNTLYLDPTSSRDLVKASRAAKAAGDIGDSLLWSPDFAFTQKSSELKKLIPHIDNARLVDAIRGLNDGEVVVLDAYQSNRALAKLHESVHQNLTSLDFTPETIETLDATPALQQLRKELTASASYYSKVDPETLAHEALAFGLTGDYGHFKVSRHTLRSAAEEALRALSRDNPDVPIDVLRKLALGDGRAVVEQVKRDVADSKKFGFDSPYEFAQHRNEVVNEANPETIAEAHEQTPEVFNETHATNLPVADRAAILSSTGKTTGTLRSPVTKDLQLGTTEDTARFFYDISADPKGFLQEANGNLAVLELSLKNRGYDGYYYGDSGVPGGTQFNLFNEKITEGKSPKRATPRVRRLPIEDRQQSLFTENARKAAQEVLKEDQTLTPDEKVLTTNMLNLLKQGDLFGEPLTSGKSPRKRYPRRNRGPIPGEQLGLFDAENAPTSDFTTGSMKFPDAPPTGPLAYPHGATTAKLSLDNIRKSPEYQEMTKEAREATPEGEQQDLFGKVPEGLDSYVTGMLGAPESDIQSHMERVRARAIAEGIDVPPKKRRSPLRNKQDSLFRIEEDLNEIANRLKETKQYSPEIMKALIDSTREPQQGELFPENEINYALTPDQISARIASLKEAAQKLGVEPEIKRLEGETKTRALYRIEEEVAADAINKGQQKLFETGKATRKRKTPATKTTKKGKGVQPTLDFETQPQLAPQTETTPVQQGMSPRDIAMKLRAFASSNKPSEEPALAIPTIPEAKPVEQAPAPAPSGKPQSIAEMLRAARAQAEQQGIQQQAQEVSPEDMSIGARINRIADKVDDPIMAQALRKIATEVSTQTAQPAMPEVTIAPKLGSAPISAGGKEERAFDLEKMKNLANKLSGITPKYRLQDNPEEFLKSGSYVVISGNKARAQSEAGSRLNKELFEELRRKGFEVYKTSGKTQGNAEDSILVPVNSKDDIDLLKGVAFKYKQNQIFSSYQGVYTAPFTDATTQRENFSRSNNMLVGDLAKTHDNYTEVFYPGGSASFSVPDLFDATRSSRITPKQQKIYDAVGFEARYNKANAFSARVAERVSGLPQVSNTSEAMAALDKIYGRRFERKEKLSEGEQVARYIGDWTGTVKDAIDSGVQSKGFYTDDMNRMFETLSKEFPDIDASKAARLAFSTMIAVTSPRNTVAANFETAKDVFKRFLRSLQSPQQGRIPNTTEDGMNYEFFTRGLGKLDKLFNGYVFNSETGKMEFSKPFRNNINKYGMQAIFDYLNSPGATREFNAQEMFGYKVGSFLMNLYGNTQVPTVDSWIVRSWRLNNGKMFTNKGEVNDGISEGLGNRIRGAIQSIAGRLNQQGYDVTPAEVQSIIWNHMKSMNDTMTGKTSINKFSEAAKRALTTDPATGKELYSFWNKYGPSLRDADPNIGEDAYIQRAKSKSRILYRTDQEYINDLRDDVLFSHLENQIEKDLPDSFTMGELSKYVKNPKHGINKEELRWSFIPEMSKQYGQKDVLQKADVLNAIRSNRIKLYEYNSQRYLSAVDRRLAYSDAILTAERLMELQTKQELTPEQRDQLESAFDAAEVFARDFDPQYEFYEKEAKVPDFRNSHMMSFTDEENIRKGATPRLYVMPGGDNYRTYLVKAKGIVSADKHYKDGDSIASMRVTDRIINAKKAFTIEEVQSDHFQNMAKSGLDTPENRKKHEDEAARYVQLEKQAEQEMNDLVQHTGKYAAWTDEDYSREINGQTQYDKEFQFLDKSRREYSNLATAARVKVYNLAQDAPLRDVWHKVMLKRALQEASRYGYDKISLVGGATAKGRATSWFRGMEDQPEMAAKIAKLEHGLGNFYDQKMPDAMRELAEQHGSQVYMENYTDDSGKEHYVWSMDVTPSMKERMPLYRTDASDRPSHLLDEPEKSPMREFDGHQIYEDAPGVKRYVARGTDGSILAAVQVVDMQGRKQITDVQIKPEAQNEGVAAYLLAQIKGAETKVNLPEAASDVAYKTAKYRIQYPTNEDGWVAFGEQLKGAPLTPEEETHIRNAFQTNPGENEMVLATLPMKRSIPEFLLKVYKAGLLSGVGTTTTNLLSNASMAALEEVSRIPAALIDAAISKVTGTDRTVLAPSLEAVGEGLKGVRNEGWEAFKEALINGDYENIYQIPVQAGIPVLDQSVGKAADYVFRFMSGQDKLFKGYLFRRAMYEQAKLEEMNGGRPWQDVMQSPDQAQIDAALRATAYGTFQQDNFANDMYVKTKGFLQKNARPLAWFLDLNLPFVKTGTNVASNALDYLGISGLVKFGHIASDVVDTASLTQTGKNFVKVLSEPETRREVTELSSRGLVGWAFIRAGYALAKAGLLTADYDDKDKKQLNALAERNAPFLSARVGDRWISFQRLSPVGSFFAAGALMYADKEDGVIENVTDIARLATQQFPLGKFSQELFNKDKSFADYFVPTGNSFVPAIVRDFARFGDVKRETRVQGKDLASFMERRKQQFMSAVPGLRKSLEPRTTALGQTIDEGEPLLGSTKARNSELIQELSRVHWFPAHSDYDKDARKYVDRPLELRQQITEGLSRIVASPEYQALEDDETKQNYLEKATGIMKKAWDEAHPDDEKAQKRQEKREASTQERSIIQDILKR